MIYAKKTAASINFFLFYGGNCSILKRKNAICFKNKQMQIFYVDSAEKSRIIPFIHSRGGEIGRRGGLKIRCQRWRVGSSPTLGTKILENPKHIQSWGFLLSNEKYNN